MRELDAQKVVAVRALEEADPDGSWIPAAAKRRAASIAREEQGAGATIDEGAYLSRRADLLLEGLQMPALRRALPLTRYGAGLGWIVAGGALTLGLSLEAVTSGRRVEVLKFPLLGLFLWNVCVYVATAFHAVWPRLRSAPRPDVAVEDRDRPRRNRGSRFLSLPSWCLNALGRRLLPRSSDFEMRALGAFTREWTRTSGPLAMARSAALFHFAAALLVLGMVVSMYARGLSTEYRATWESTWLGPDVARAILSIYLWPGRLLGIDIPDLESIRAPRDGPAAAWIHLHACAATAYVVVPRSLLALWEHSRARRMARRVPLDLTEGYYRRLLAPHAGSMTRIEVVPYDHRPNPRAIENLKALLLTAYGYSAHVTIAEPIPYGAPPHLAHTGPDGPADVCLVLFSLAAVPEVDVHVSFVLAVRNEFGGPRSMSVLVDTSRLAARSADSGRIDQRRRIWTDALKEAGVVPAHLDLSVGPTDEALSQIERSRGLAKAGA